MVIFKKCCNFALVIELDRHIEILLLKNDCVIVPGLGGFVASHIPAIYDINDNTFIPPRRTLGFNPKLNINDSLLVQSYTETYDISFPEAFQKIEEEVNELKQILNEKGSYELYDIGELYTNEEGNIEFTPCESGILTPSLYSLSSFSMQKSAKENTSEHIRTQKKEPKNTIKAAEDIYTTNNKNKDYSKTTNILINLAASIIAVITFMFFSTPINNNTKTANMGNMDKSIINALIGAENNNSNNKTKIILANNQNKNKEKTSTADKDKTIKNNSASKENNIKTNDKNKDYYCIVLASRVTKKNAESFVKSLKEKGLEEAAVLNKSNKSIKVVYGHYSSKTDAHNKLNELKDNEYFQDAWIYQVNI